MNVRPLVEAVAYVFWRLPGTPSSDADPEWAARLLEQLAERLQELSAEDRLEFRAELMALAAIESEDDPLASSRRHFYRVFPDYLGWED